MSTCDRLETNSFKEFISCTHLHQPRDKTELRPTEPLLTGPEGGSHFGITEEEPRGFLVLNPCLGRGLGREEQSSLNLTTLPVTEPFPLSHGEVEMSSSLQDPAWWPTVCTLTLEMPLLSVLPGNKPAHEQWPLAFSGRFCPRTRPLGEATGSYVCYRGLNPSDAVDWTKSGHLAQRGPIRGPFSWKLAIITKIVPSRYGLVSYKEKQKKNHGND